MKKCLVAYLITGKKKLGGEGEIFRFQIRCCWIFNYRNIICRGTPLCWDSPTSNTDLASYKRINLCDVNISMKLWIPALKLKWRDQTLWNRTKLYFYDSTRVNIWPAVCFRDDSLRSHLVLFFCLFMNLESHLRPLRKSFRWSYWPCTVKPSLSTATPHPRWNHSLYPIFQA